MGRVYSPWLHNIGIDTKYYKRQQYLKFRKKREAAHGVAEEGLEDIFDPANLMAQDEEDEGTFARGSRRITKSGITAISKGELIVPAHLNPFNPDRKRANPRKDLANEKKIKNKFIKKILDEEIQTNAFGTFGEGVKEEKDILSKVW